MYLIEVHPRPGENLPALHDMGTLSGGSAENPHIGDSGLNGEREQGVRDVGPKCHGRLHPPPADSDYRIAALIMVYMGLLCVQKGTRRWGKGEMSGNGEAAVEQLIWGAVYFPLFFMNCSLRVKKKRICYGC